MSDRTWERLGALSGLVAAVLLGASFVIFLGTSPIGDVPDIANAPEEAVPYIDDNQTALKVELLLNSIAFVLFLWFLGSLWSRLRAAEGGPARVSAIASAGGIAGAVAALMAFVFEAPAVLNPSEELAVPELYTLGVMSIGLGTTAFTVFFLAAGKVILKTGALPRVIGLLAFLAAVAAALGFVSIFADEGPFNPATGAFGFWVRFGAFVVWLALASLALAVVAGRPVRR